MGGCQWWPGTPRADRLFAMSGRPRHAAARAALLPAAWSVAALLPFSRDSSGPRSVPDPTAKPAELRLSLETDRTSYAPGDSIRARLTVSHGGGPAEILEFGTSRRCDFEIRDAAGTAVWRWSADRAFAQVMGEVTLAAGQPPLVCSERLPAPGAPGRYEVVGSLAAIGRPLTATAIVTVATAIRRP